jgi:O-antigen ligase
MSAVPSRTWQTILPPCLLIAILPVTHTIALRLLLLALTLGIALRAWMREPHPPVPARRALTIWSAIAVASLAWSVDREYSSGEAINEIGYAMAAYFSFFTLGRTEHDIRRLMIGLFVGVGLVSAFAIVNFLRVGDWLVGESIGIGDRNAFSTTVSLASVAFMLVLTHRRLAPGPPLLAWLVLASGLVAASLTLNRTMWPALGAAAIVYLLTYNANRLHSPRNRVVAALLVVLIAAISTSQFFLTTKVRRSEQSASQGVLATVINDERIPIWKYALQRAADRPLTGFGYGRGILRKDFRAKIGIDLGWHAHNVFLNHAISVGLPGLAAYCLVLLALCSAFLHLGRQQDPLARSLGAFGLALLTCMFVRNLADDTIVRENALLFWSLTGMALGAGVRRIDPLSSAAAACAQSAAAE